MLKNRTFNTVWCEIMLRGRRFVPIRVRVRELRVRELRVTELRVRVRELRARELRV